MGDEARRTIFARHARLIAAALSGLTVSTTAVAQTRGVPEPSVSLERPLPPPSAGGGAHFGVGAEALATTTGAESAGGEGGGIAYLGWGNRLEFRALVLARAGGTLDGLVFPLGAGLTTRLFYARQPGLELGFGLSLSGGYLIAPGSERTLESGPFVDARFEPTVFRLDDGLGDFGVFFGVRFARRNDESPAFSPATATLGAAYSFTFGARGPEPAVAVGRRRGQIFPIPGPPGSADSRGERRIHDDQLTE
jgi:hypothetical protein